VEYLRDVKPVLSESCYKCHGASQQKSGLRLDTVAFAIKGGENGPGFKPGNSAESLLVQLLKGTHPAVAAMPYKKPPLTTAQIKAIAEWIDAGPVPDEHERPESAVWSSLPLSALRSPRRAARGQSQIPSTFILARLRRKNSTVSRRTASL
jgi:hypothetical protein